MTAETYDIGKCEVSLDQAKIELERLLSDVRFRVSDRQRDILRYLAERRIAGLEDSVKAYSIALDVLGRPSGFDAATDPIVRIEISRLRAALESYYGVFGSELGVSIHIPKGSYLALFLKAAVADEPSHPSLRQDGPGARHSPRTNETRIFNTLPYGRFWIAGIGFLVVFALAVVALLQFRPAITPKPGLTVSVTAASPQMDGEAALVRDALLIALTQFQTVIVTSPRTAGARGDVSVPGYDLEVKYYGDGDDRSVWWQLADHRSGVLLRSDVEKIETNGRSIAAVQEEMAGILARRVAAARGIVNGIEIQRSQPGALGNACVLRAEYALNEGGSRDIAAADICLERTLSRVPDDPDANALLSRVLMVPHGRAVDVPARDRALELAKRAASLAPLSDRAQVALMTVHFLDGRTDAAIEAGNRAIALNPNNMEVAASLGLVLFSSGYWKAGVDLAQNASDQSDVAPRDALVVLALNAYRNGKWSQASLLSEQISGTDFMVRAIRAAASGQLGASDASARLGDVRMHGRDFESFFRERMTTVRMQPEIIADLETGLSKAGANFRSIASTQHP